LVASFVLALILAGTECTRWLSAPGVTLNGQPVETVDTAPGGQYRDLRVQVK
jgi:hypothetical protein